MPPQLASGRYVCPLAGKSWTTPPFPSRFYPVVLGVRSSELQRLLPQVYGQWRERGSTADIGLLRAICNSSSGLVRATDGMNHGVNWSWRMLLDACWAERCCGCPRWQFSEEQTLAGQHNNQLSNLQTWNTGKWKFLKKSCPLKQLMFHSVSLIV